MTNKTLIIAEKPSVARDLTQAIDGSFDNQKNYFESDKFIVTYAVGHLVTICSPPEVDERYKSWSLDLLPIIPSQFPLKEIAYNKSQLRVVSKLIKRRDVSNVINACDAGREGELIFRYIFQFVYGDKKHNKIIQRLWLQSMTKGAIKEGFANLRDDESMKHLEDAAMSRSEADWLVGINASRALTGWYSRFGGFFLTPCGRVQTPTLFIIYQREKERDEFVSEPYWEIEADFSMNVGSYKAKWVNANFKKDAKNPHSKSNRLWDKKEALAIVTKCKGKKAIVTEATKSSFQSCPLLYDLTSLQREANTRFGFPARMTLDIMQALYEKHKMITYPRTGSRHLPTDYIDTVKATMKKLESGFLGEYTKKVLDQNWIKPVKKIFDNSKITDHYAVVPTGFQKGGLSDAEKKVYTMILQRFIAIFYPDAEYLNTKRNSIVEEEVFRVEGKVLKFKGWKEVYGNFGDDKNLASLDTSKEIIAQDVLLEDKETKPPARFTEASLLSIMESAGKLVEEEELKEAMKGNGLGTPATRASIIEGLIKDKYLIREDKNLVPTTKARELSETLVAMQIEELLKPEMTGEWEQKLSNIQEGNFDRKVFMKEISNFTKNIVSKIKAFDSEKESLREKIFVFEGQQFYQSLSYYENEERTIRIRRYLGGRSFLSEEIQLLLKDRKIGPLSGFVSKKSGRPFSAMICLNKENKVEFVFEDIAETKPDFSELKALGTSPVDKTEVYETDMNFVSTSFYDKDNSKGLKIGKMILGKEITSENVKLMLVNGKSDLIKGFRSNKTKRLFDAYLLLSKLGKVSFAFPERKFKRKKS